MNRSAEAMTLFAVMCAGQITGILPPEQATSERIGALMGGISEAVAG